MASRWAGLLALAVVLLASGLFAHDAPVVAQRATLPPSWTPTFTPTATQTPTISPTPSPTPTVDPETFCQQRFVVDAPATGVSVPYGESFQMIVAFEQRGLRARLAAVHRLGQEGVQIDIPGPGMFVPNIGTQALPRTGLYDWRLELIDEDDNILCERVGYFFVQPQSLYTPPPPTETPLPVTVVVVTATPGADETAEPQAATMTPTSRVPIIQGAESILPLPTGITPETPTP